MKSDLTFIHIDACCIDFVREQPEILIIVFKKQVKMHWPIKPTLIHLNTEAIPAPFDFSLFLKTVIFLYVWFAYSTVNIFLEEQGVKRLLNLEYLKFFWDTLITDAKSETE